MWTKERLEKVKGIAYHALPKNMRKEHGDDCKSFVLAELAVNPQRPIRFLVVEYIRETFGRTGKRLASVTSIPLGGMPQDIQYDYMRHDGDFEKIDLLLAVDLLPPKLRLIAQMIFMGFTYEEIGEEFGCSQANISILTRRMKLTDAGDTDSAQGDDGDSVGTSEVLAAHSVASDGRVSGQKLGSFARSS